MDDNIALPLSFADIADRSHRLLVDWLSRNDLGVPASQMADPLNIAGSFLELTAKMMADPVKMMSAQMSLWQDYLELWQDTTSRLLGNSDCPVTTPSSAKDERFRDVIWEENHIFNYIKQSYLLTSRWVERTVGEVEGLDPRTRETVDFYTRQFVSALSPTNFALTNPEVIRATLETRGENLLHGLRNLLHDLDRLHDQLLTGRSSQERFELARTIATTSGKVIYRNELIELIQYAPLTSKVVRRPLLFIPAWINKYYIFDLGENNSLVRWAVAQGHTVFMISWVNPDADSKARTFEDYVRDGTLKALEVIEQATGEYETDCVGYCIGGTLLAATAAFLASKGEARIQTATFITTMLDFSQPGELGAFVDEAILSYLEGKEEAGGCEARTVAAIFKRLRENDLIWSFVVNNYLLGRDSFPYELLHWNADAPSVPLELHRYYLNKFYQQNKLVAPGGITVCGEAIDLRRIGIPTYFLATREDYIAPWKSAYQAMQILGGPSRFALAASGHVAGVVNPPPANKYCFWSNRRSPASPDEWLATASQTEGSWWTDWQAWLLELAGDERVSARRPERGRLRPVADAPGAYVKAGAL